MNVPIITLEIQAMREQLRVALTDHAFKLDSNIQTAIDTFLTEENVTRIVNDQAKAVLESLIRSEVDHFFRYGKGREAVAAEVKRRLIENNTHTPLDESDG